jgi:hypothetical protein
MVNEEWRPWDIVVEMVDESMVIEVDCRRVVEGYESSEVWKEWVYWVLEEMQENEWMRIFIYKVWVLEVSSCNSERINIDEDTWNTEITIE